MAGFALTPEGLRSFSGSASRNGLNFGRSFRVNSLSVCRTNSFFQFRPLLCQLVHLLDGFIISVLGAVSGAVRLGPGLNVPPIFGSVKVRYRIYPIYVSAKSVQTLLASQL